MVNKKNKKDQSDTTKSELAEAADTDLAADSPVDKVEVTDAEAETKPAATETSDASAAKVEPEAAEEDDDDDDSVRNIPIKAKTGAAKKDDKPAAKAETATAAESTEIPKASADDAAKPAGAEPAPPAAPPAPAPGTELSPEVAELHAMFPAVEAGVIEVVLESCGGSQDRAIEQLLAMTDPDFQPDAASSRQAELARQAELDAAFARALVMQEHEDERAQRRTHRQAEPGALPYQPRVRRPRPQGQPEHGEEHAQGEGYGHRDTQGQGQQQGGQFDEQLAVLEERVSQIAEQGKQTFNTLFTRAKAKYDEFAAQQADAARQREAQAAEGGVPGGGQQGAGAFGGAGWQSRASGVAAGASGLAAGATAKLNALWGTQPQQQYQQGPERTNSTSPAGRPAPARWSPTDSYEDMHDAQPLNPTINVGGRASPRGGASPPPAPGKIDMAKLGFLPKKRVDLMSASASPAPASGASASASATSLRSEESGRSLLDKVPKSPVGETSPHTLGDSDDDELEYQENPFDKK